MSITKKYSSYEFLLLYLFLYHRTNKDISIVLKEALLLFQIFSACFHDLQLKRKSYLRAANMSKFQLCFEDFIRNILFPVIYKIQQIPPWRYDLAQLFQNYYEVKSMPKEHIYELRLSASGHPQEVEVLCASYDYLLIVKEKFCCRKRFSIFCCCTVLFRI